jgi:hypothetical protein
MARTKKEQPTGGAYAELLVPIQKLEKDVRQAVRTMPIGQARFLVDAYYSLQMDRIAKAAQIRAMEAADQREPHEVLDWLFAQDEILEKSMKNVLGDFAESRVVGRWALSINGIGPVISAGLIANIKMVVWVCAASPEVKKKRVRVKEQCNILNPCTVACHEERTSMAGRIWRYAGLDPTVTWGKGEKRPWNSALKVLCWKIGESFVKQHNNPKDFYGQFYRMRKEREVKKNEALEFRDQAEHILKTKRIGQETEAYKWYSQGMLPPAHIQARSKRYAVKLFLSHWLQVAYRETFNADAPRPYALDILGHKDEIQVPNWPF